MRHAQASEVILSAVVMLAILLLFLIVIVITAKCKQDRSFEVHDKSQQSQKQETQISAIFSPFYTGFFRGVPPSPSHSLPNPRKKEVKLSRPLEVHGRDGGNPRTVNWLKKWQVDNFDIESSQTMRTAKPRALTPRDSLKVTLSMHSKLSTLSQAPHN